MTTTRTWNVYGAPGHRQRESFNPSYTHDWKEDGIKIEVFNSDKTGTNEYTTVRITAADAKECQRVLDGQISDGIFENSNTGWIEEVDESKVKDEDGREIDYDSAVALMDDEIREDLHDKLSPCTTQIFYDAYCKAHYAKYGEEFEVN